MIIFRLQGTAIRVIPCTFILIFYCCVLFFIIDASSATVKNVLFFLIEIFFHLQMSVFMLY